MATVASAIAAATMKKSKSKKKVNIRTEPDCEVHSLAGPSSDPNLAADASRTPVHASPSSSSIHNSLISSLISSSDDTTPPGKDKTTFEKELAQSADSPPSASPPTLSQFETPSSGHVSPVPSILTTSPLSTKPDTAEFGEPSPGSPKNDKSDPKPTPKKRTSKGSFNAKPNLDVPTGHGSGTRDTISAPTSPTLSPSSAQHTHHPNLFNKSESNGSIASEPTASPPHSPFLHSPHAMGSVSPALNSSSSTIGSIASEPPYSSSKRHSHLDRQALSDHQPSSDETRALRVDHAHEKLKQFFGDPYVVEDSGKVGWAPQPRHVKETKLRQRFGEEVPFQTVPSHLAQHRHSKNIEDSHDSDSESFSLDVDPETVAKERELRSTHKVHRFFGDRTAGQDAFSPIARGHSASSGLSSSPSKHIRRVDSKSLEMDVGDDPDFASTSSHKRRTYSPGSLSPPRQYQGRLAGLDEADELDSTGPSIQPSNVDVLKLNKFFGRRVNIIKVDMVSQSRRNSTAHAARDDMFLYTAMEISRCDSATSSMKSEYAPMVAPDSGLTRTTNEPMFPELQTPYAHHRARGSSSERELVRRSSDSDERPDSPAFMAAIAEYRRDIDFFDPFSIPTPKSRRRLFTPPTPHYRFTGSSERAQPALPHSSSTPSVRIRKSSKTLSHESGPISPASSSAISTKSSKSSSRSLKSSGSRKSNKTKSESKETKEVKEATTSTMESLPASTTSSERSMRRRSTLTHLDSAKQIRDVEPDLSLTSASARDIPSHHRDSSGGSDDELRLEQIRESHRNRKLRRMFGEDVSVTDVQVAPQPSWTKLKRRFTFGRDQKK